MYKKQKYLFLWQKYKKTENRENEFEIWPKHSKDNKSNNKDDYNVDDNHDEVGKDDVLLKNKSTFHFGDALSLKYYPDIKQDMRLYLYFFLYFVGWR